MYLQDFLTIGSTTKNHTIKTPERSRMPGEKHKAHLFISVPRNKPRRYCDLYS